jgi:hypothetical protein
MKEIYRLRGSQDESTATIVTSFNPDNASYTGFITYRSYGRELFTESTRIERLYAMDALADARRLMNDQGDWIAV